MQYTCRIQGQDMHCVIISDRDLVAPVFCFSGMAPLGPVSGGSLVKSVGSYTEVALPDLRAGEEHRVVLRYQDGFTPANRAWMPLGPYLRCGHDLVVLPATPAGRQVALTPNVTDLTGLPIAPQPDVWIPASGHLEIDGFRSDDAQMAAVARLAKRQNMRFEGDFPISFDVSDLSEGAYEIEIAPSHVRVRAGTASGRFYAGITLLSLLQSGPLACGKIQDRPRFEWRGQHLDTARHFYEADTILALLDLMAMLKMNRFHWHFADDEAFRLELSCLPELWQKTAMRGEGHMMPGLFAGAPEQGGTYSIETAKAIITHAKDLHIEVLPEIETPAHALCLTTLYPDTRDPDDTGTERSVQGYAGNVMNPAMPKTWEILEKLVAEVGQIFPFGHVHLGCDELPEGTWMHSPLAHEMMAEHGLETTQDLQGWTISKLASVAVEYGLRPAAWEEAAQGAGGGIGHNAILFSWTGQGPGLAAAKAGYDVVMTPAQHVYMDMAHTDDVDDWGASWAAFVDLPDTINWTPVQDPSVKDRIIGVQGAFWSEFTTQDDQLWPMLMPRMLGVASMCWQSDRPDLNMLQGLAGLYHVDAQGGVTLGLQG